jgi:hypothetical protein
MRARDTMGSRGRRERYDVEVACHDRGSGLEDSRVPLTEKHADPGQLSSLAFLSCFADEKT